MRRTGVSPSTIARAGGIAALALAVAAPVVLAAPTPALAARNDDSSAEVVAFYRSRGYQPLWFSARSVAAAQQLTQLLLTARADNRNPNNYRAKAVASAVRAAAASRDPMAIRRADMMLSQAFEDYVRDLKRDPNVGIIYVAPELRPTPPTASPLHMEAASAPSLGDYIGQMLFMNAIYASLRQALASRIYSNSPDYRQLVLKLERARAVPSS